MSPVSSDTVFHFTRALADLVDILKSEFRPHYSIEDVTALRVKPAEGDVVVALPMVSFCDVPLSQATEHMRTYGRYAIGLTKSWAMKQGLTPVLYAHSSSPTLVALAEIAREASAQGPSRVNTLDHMTRILFFSKPYRGRFWRNGEWRDDVCFYNEREWRFMPERPFQDFVVLIGKEALNQRKRAAANGLVAKHRLSFEPTDIRYVIVASETEILPMIRHLEAIKGSKYSWDDVKLLSSRVISAEQVEADF